MHVYSCCISTPIFSLSRCKPAVADNENVTVTPPLEKVAVFEQVVDDILSRKQTTETYNVCRLCSGGWNATSALAALQQVLVDVCRHSGKCNVVM